MRGFAAEYFLPAIGDDIELRKIEVLRKRSRGRVADREAFAVCRNPVRVRYAHARGRAVPGENHIVRKIHLCEIGQFAVRRLGDLRVFQLQLLHDVGRPAFAERFPRQYLDTARTQERPQRHFHGAGIGGRHDANLVGGGHAEHFARELDRVLQTRLARLRAVRAADQRFFEVLEVPAWALGAGAGGKMAYARARGRLCHLTYPSR